MAKLSNAEYRVYKLLLKGKSNGEMAEILGIKEGSIKYHLTSIYKKLKVTGDRDLLSKELGRFITIETENILKTLEVLDEA